MLDDPEAGWPPRTPVHPRGAHRPAGRGRSRAHGRPRGPGLLRPGPRLPARPRARRHLGPGRARAGRRRAPGVPPARHPGPRPREEVEATRHVRGGCGASARPAGSQMGSPTRRKPPSPATLYPKSLLRVRCPTAVPARSDHSDGRIGVTTSAGARCHSDPPRRHGRLLRLRGHPGPPRPPRRAGDRGRRLPRGGAVGQLPRPAVGSAVRAADDPRPPAVPAGGRDRPRLRDLRVGVDVGDGDLPAGHPAGGGALARRGLPRRPRLHPSARVAAATSPSSCAPPSTTSRASPARWGSRPRSRSPSSPAVGRSPTAWWSCRRRRPPPSSTRSTSASSGGWGRRPRRCCTGSDWSRSATSPTPRCAPCGAPSVTTSAPTSTSWPGGPTAG